jgi:predicted small metal-binding protein
MATKEYKQLSCRDAGADCDFLVRAESEDEIMTVASEHGCRVHGMCQVTPELKDQMKSIIKTVMV